MSADAYSIKTITWGPVTRARALGLTAREYSHLGEFSNNADKLGLKSVSVGKAPGLGCRLKLSGRHDYEALLNNGIALLGRVEASGKRIKLHEGGTNVEVDLEHASQDHRKRREKQWLT